MTLGLTWADPDRPHLPNNNSGIDMVRLHQGSCCWHTIHSPWSGGKSDFEDVYGVGVASRFAHRALRKAGNEELQRMIHKRRPGPNSSIRSAFLGTTHAALPCGL